MSIGGATDHPAAAKAAVSPAAPEKISQKQYEGEPPQDYTDAEWNDYADQRIRDLEDQRRALQ